jgi:hypothetical protein
MARVRLVRISTVLVTAKILNASVGKVSFDDTHNMLFLDEI